MLATLSEEHVGLDDQPRALQPWVAIEQVHKVGVSPHLEAPKFLALAFYKQLRALSTLAVCTLPVRHSREDQCPSNGCYALSAGVLSRTP